MLVVFAVMISMVAEVVELASVLHSHQFCCGNAEGLDKSLSETVTITCALIGKWMGQLD